DLRDGESASIARRHASGTSSPHSPRRPATLARPKSSRAIAEGATAMSVIVRPYRRGGWEVDIRLVLPDDSEHRQRRKAPVASKHAAQRWGEAREREWYHELTHPQPKADPPKEVPTLEGFTDRFLDGYARANRQKPSGIAAKETILNVHLVLLLGTKRLNAITNEVVQ